MVEDGRAIPKSQMEQQLPGGGVLEVVDYTILFKSPMNGVKSTKTFRLEATSYPKRIAIFERDTTTGVGIYKFEQEKLILCVTRGSAAQSPSQFTAPPNSGRTLIVLTRFQPGTSQVPGLNTHVRQPPPVERPVPPQQTTPSVPVSYQAKPAVPATPTPPPVPQSAPAPQPNPAIVSSGNASRVLTDDQVRAMTLGTWRMNDADGSIDIVFEPSGTFQTYRYYRTLSNFQYVFVPTPTATGTWSITDGRLIAK